MKSTTTLLASFLTICSINTIQAQQIETARISGRVLQTGAKPVEFATITLLKAKDSSLVKGAIADINGQYEFEQIKQGKYLIAAAYVGMTKAYSKPFEVKGSAPVSMETLTLGADAKNLKEVNVTAKKPFIEQRADKMIVNVENSIIGAGGTAMEALEKSPGVSIDKDDNISLKGKSGVVIMIDGKLTNMSSQDVAQLLKSMPSSNIEQIELITNPSAKYDAAGNSGIINIKLKKNRMVGSNGNVSLFGAYGLTPKYGGALNLNHRNEKFNLFGSYNYNHRENQQHLGLYRTGTTEGRPTVFDQDNERKRKSDYHGVKVGMDYFINKNNTIGVMVDAGFRSNTEPADALTKIGDGQRVDSTLKTHTNADGTWRRWAYNVNYKAILDTTGKELNIDLDYARNSEERGNDIFSTIWDSAGKNYMRGDTSRNSQPNSIDIKTIKADYVHPLRNQAKLEAGFKLSFVKTDNDAKFDSLRSGNWVYDKNRSNHFIYKENVNAAYINFQKQFKKLNVQLGLRAEQSNIEGNSITMNQVTDTSYFNLFPSVFVSYDVHKNHQLGLSYSRRLQRPDYEDLNPFQIYLDRYTLISGNPYLKPSYANSVEFTHTFKHFLTTSVGYTHTKDKITQIVEADKDVVSGDTLNIRYKYLNVAKSDIVNLNISFPVTITKWWSSFTYLSAYYNKFQTIVDNQSVNISSGGFMGRTQQTFTLPKDLSAEVSVFYLSPQIADEGLFRMKHMCAVDLGVSKQILHKKGSLKLNVNDVFNIQRFRGSFENGGRYTGVTSKWESRQVRLTFNYRFGNTNIKGARNRKTGLEDEQGRVKDGN
ncbi:Outer membrane receptor proteins, mostly Fe transport [Chitinophaga sp. YR627]|uniref:outer membrane beta-barrel family protein n=1 Tax=Chitinophaga sp. YR627 TaxID=1881041 RepID=UPI0008EEFB5C|nr:outer membrane beta-barrel family protein [Chitinophaga sp. YR627]SFO56354.1 Outer membrane receptor proteins, mostly Fe transport [Chitinophaga sp. YR627]